MYTKEEQDNFRKLARLFILNHLGIVGNVNGRKKETMKHCLVIGGTGMLKDVSLWLIQQGNHVTVIGRQQKKMQNLINEANYSLKLSPLLVDYTNYNSFRTALIESQETHGSFDCVIAWLHGSDIRGLGVAFSSNSYHEECDFIPY